MKLLKKAGATSEIWQVFIRDSSSTTGGGLTGLTNASGSLTAYYHRDTDTTATVISLVTMTVGTFTSSGFKEIDATNMPGWYQFCPPNAALASGAKACAFHLKGATNMAPLPIECQLATQFDVDASVTQTGDAYARLGAPAGASVSADIAAAKVDTAAIKLQTDKLAFTVTNQVDCNVLDWKSATAPAMTGDAFARLGAAGAGLTALGDTRLANLDAAVSGRMATYAQPTGFLAATFPGTVASTTNITGGTITTVTNLTNAPSAGDFTATMKTSLNAATPAVTVSDKTGFALTSGERTAIANEVEAQIIDETDSEKVLTAITDKIASVNPDLGGLTVSAIASAVWAAATRVLTAGTNISLAKGTGVTGFNDPTAAATASAVRTELATELARVDVATSTRLATSGYTAPLDAAGVRTAVGLATANLDTQLDALPTNTELATALAAADDATLNAIAALPSAATIAATVRDVDNGSPAAGSLGEAARNADAKAAVLIDTIGTPANGTVSEDIAAVPGSVWASVMEGATTAVQFMRGFAAVLLGKASGLATTTATYRDTGDSKDRVVATVDASGNRSAVTRDLT